MAIDFPASPNANQTFTVGSITYKWDGTKWIGLGVTPADKLIEGSNSLELDANNDLVYTAPGTLKVNSADASGYVAEFNQTNTSNSGQILINSPTDGESRPVLLDMARAGNVQWSLGQGYLDTSDAFHISTTTLSSGFSNSKVTLTPDGDVGIGENSPADRLVVQKTNASGDVAVRIKNDTLTDGDATNPTTASLYLNTSTGDFNTFYIQARRNDNDTHFGYSDPRDANHVPTMVLTNEKQVLIGTTIPNSFNGVGQAHNLIVVGETSDTDITDNSKAAITISNKDGTADNTAGLHFAREDTDGNPHYCGASIVAQFKETQVTGQYPKADLAFLTSIAANNAPSEKMRIYANGAVTKPDNPLIQTQMSDVYGAAQSLTVSPPSAISNGAASISRGTNGFSNTGTNAFTYVCPVDGIYAVFAHISLGNVTQPDNTREAGDRTIWTMAYTLGGGNLPLQNYVEIIDTNVFDFENASYYNLWNFTAGTRVGCGLNSGNGQASGLAMQWGVHLIQ